MHHSFILQMSARGKGQWVWTYSLGGQEECLWPAAVDVISSTFKEAVALAVRDAVPAIVQQVRSYDKAQAVE